MSNVKSKKLHRLLAVVLSLVMVISLLPLPAIVKAETPEHPGKLTVTVKKEDGTPIQGAKITSSTDGITFDPVTGADGVAEITADATVEYPAEFSAEISAEGYKQSSLTETIESQESTQNFDVFMQPKKSTGPMGEVVATGITAPYSGAEQQLVYVENAEGRTITYVLEHGNEHGEPTEEVPTATDAGVYKVTVRVMKDGKVRHSQTVTSEITPIDITGISIEKRTMPYNGAAQKLVELNGSLEENDKLTWVVNEETIESKKIPTATNVGTYEVTLKVNRGPNYNELVLGPVSSEIFNGTMDLGDLEIQGWEGVYQEDDEGNAIPQPVVTVKNEDPERYTLQYQMNDGSLIPDESAWVDEIPTVTEAGSYTVLVRAVEYGYDNEDVAVNPAASAVTPYNVFIAKAKREIEFTQGYTNGETTAITLEDPLPFALEYDFAATNLKPMAGDSIQYSLEVAGGDAEAAAIDSTSGKVNVSYPGSITISAELADNGNYGGCTITHTLQISSESKVSGTYLKFEKTEVPEYIIGTDDLVAKNTASKIFEGKDHGDIHYSVENGAELGLTAEDGEVTVADYGKLVKAAENAEGQRLTVNVIAHKDSDGYYGEGEISYTVNVRFLETPAAPYTLSDANPETGWYTDNVSVTPAEGYTIAKNVASDGKNFEDHVVFDEQGEITEHVYLRNKAGSGITAPVTVNACIDTEAPRSQDMKIEFSNDTLMAKVGEKLGFYNPEVTITFTASDAASGIDHFNWSYIRDEDASESNEPDIKDQELAVTSDGLTATATLTLPAEKAKQYRGHISFYATDKAGNRSSSVTENYTFVVDTIAPTVEVKYLGAAEGITEKQCIDGVHYFNGAIKAELTFTEANFDSEDVRITVQKDGRPYHIEKIEWGTRNAEDVTVGTFSLPEDGDYVVSVKYTDKARNEMVDYESETMTVDGTDPVVGLEYVHDEETKEQKTVFTIQEHNFRPVDLTVTGTRKDITGKDTELNQEELTKLLREAQWQKNGDTYTFEYDGYTDGIYNLELHYTDISGHEAAAAASGEFIIDHTAPTNIKIEYAKSPADTFLEIITLGFYNPSVTVRFTARDTAAGVESFHWTYTKEADASIINHPETLSDSVEAVQDQTDLSKFTAEITMTATELEQYRGHLTVSAEDTYQNDSNKVDDSGNVFVVDNIAPTMKIEYSKADRVAGPANTCYYNKDIAVQLTVTEANFYPEDVKISITKDGKAFDFGGAVWTERDKKDVSVGTFTLKAPQNHSGDGDYVITVEYTDRSSNVMKKYVSEKRVIDTTLPVIHVHYQNENAINTLKDREGNLRSYFDGTQTAVVTIDEHNFDAKEVNFHITAKNVAGAELSLDEMCAKSEWSVGATNDIHQITITYPGDANYTFSADYTDLATNKAEEYVPDHFTVDKTSPANLGVTYSTSVLDTVLESLTFGFYNAKMTVTVTAEDQVSGVNSFLYSYRNANGVSHVNGQLQDQKIEADEIVYSADGSKATATFSIPMMVLGGNNQFNGTVDFTANDRSENQSESFKDSRRVVVDNIAPTAEVEYNDAVNTEGNVSYYDGDIHGTITINEANFYANDVNVMVSKDNGAAVAADVAWTNESPDVHVGTFTLSEDGDYVVAVSYKDKSGNTMKAYKSNQMTIDTDIEEPVFKINGKEKANAGGAYKQDVGVEFAFADQNFDAQTITLTRTRFNTVEDVTSEYIKLNKNDKGADGKFEIPEDVENDGIYVLNIKITDKAKHTAESQVKFTVNRYGSVYEYNDALVDLIRDGGQFVTSVEDDLIIKEYNADRILGDSIKILVTRDGEPVDVEYESNPEVIDDEVEIGESGWYQYEYVIKASNFAEDGLYRISLTSKYAADDVDENESASVPDNSIDADGNQILDEMNFTVDSQAPEIRNIVNLESAIVNAQSLDVKYTIIDVGGLKSVEVIVNGKPLDTITDFQSNLFNYSGQFTLNEMTDAQTVELKVTDLAGNVTDTAADDFSTGELFEFHDKVTVSTNFFVRWYANKPLFWGSIGGVVVLAGAITAIVVAKRKKVHAESK